MENFVQPKPCTILNVKRESEHEWTFRVASEAKPDHGQFMQLSIPNLQQRERGYPVPAGPIWKRMAV